MQNLKILNKKEITRILDKIKEQYNIENREGKLFIISKDIKKINLEKLRINNLGLYIAKLDRDLRLTIEGSQLLGKLAKKNVYEINDEQANSWMSGKEINCEKEFKGFVIIKNKDDYLGSGRYSNGKIINFIPKERWIK